MLHSNSSLFSVIFFFLVGVPCRSGDCRCLLPFFRADSRFGDATLPSLGEEFSFVAGDLGDFTLGTVNCFAAVAGGGLGFAVGAACVLSCMDWVGFNCNWLLPRGGRELLLVCILRRGLIIVMGGIFGVS